MRILMASDLYYPYLLGGGEKRMYEIARRLAKKHEIHMLTRKFRGLPEYEVHEGVHIHRIFIPSGEVRLESTIDGLPFMFGSLFKGLRLDFDLCAPQQFFPIPPLWLIAKVKRRPIVATIHDVYEETWAQKYGLKGHAMSLFERIMLRLPCEIITVSGSSKLKLLERGVPRDRIKIIPNGVDLKKFDEVKAEKPGRPRLIYVGRLVKYKHVDHLLLAFSRLNSDAELYIVGEGPERSRLEKMATKLGIGRKVKFQGFVDEKRKIELLKSSHALVLPSSTEGFGIVVLEAWAAGIPVLVSDIPALTELVEDGKNGLIFRLGRIEELKKALERVLYGHEWKRMGKAGKRKVKEFDWDLIAKRHEELFLHLAG